MGWAEHWRAFWERETWKTLWSWAFVGGCLSGMAECWNWLEYFCDSVRPASRSSRTKSLALRSTLFGPAEWAANCGRWFSAPFDDSRLVVTILVVVVVVLDWVLGTLLASLIRTEAGVWLA